MIGKSQTNSVWQLLIAFANYEHKPMSLLILTLAASTAQLKLMALMCIPILNEPIAITSVGIP